MATGDKLLIIFVAAAACCFLLPLAPDGFQYWILRGPGNWLIPTLIGGGIMLTIWQSK